MTVLEFKKPEPAEQTAQGEAFCIQCDHRWQAVAPTGVVDLECPNCKTMKGHFTYLCMPEEGTEVRECDCGNQFFILTRIGHMCPNCGIYQSYD